MSLFETGQLIQICVDRVMCLSEHSSIHVHACFQLSLSCLTSHEHRRSTLIQVPSQVSNHFLHGYFHHDVVVLKIRCRRSCHRASKTCAMIKMMIKGRSPTMRHVSRTHRVALDWLFDRINLDFKIQIRYIDTKHQVTDTLTEGNFTRDEWNNLLHLFNIALFAALRISAWLVAPKRCRRGCKNKKKTGLWQADGDEPDINCLDKFLILEPSDCVEKARGYSKHLLGNLTRGREEIQNPTQRRVQMHTLAGWWLM